MPLDGLVGDSERLTIGVQQAFQHDGFDLGAGGKTLLDPGHAFAR